MLEQQLILNKNWPTLSSAPGTDADTRHNRSSSTKSMVPPPNEIDWKLLASYPGVTNFLLMSFTL